VLMVALGGLYVVQQREQLALQERISTQDVPHLRELSRLFSRFSSNHVQFINLLAASFTGSTTEGQFYRQGRQRIGRVNLAIEELAVAAQGLARDEAAAAIAQQLQRRLVD